MVYIISWSLLEQQYINYRIKNTYTCISLGKWRRPIYRGMKKTCRAVRKTYPLGEWTSLENKEDLHRNEENIYESDGIYKYGGNK